MLREDAQVVTSLLRSHSLALILAGSYVSQGQCTLPQYPGVFTQHRQRQLTFVIKDGLDHYSLRANPFLPLSCLLPNNATRPFVPSAKKSALAFKVKKFRDVFSRSIYNNVVGKIERPNGVLRTLTQQSEHKEEVRNRRGKTRTSSYRISQVQESCQEPTQRDRQGLLLELQM